MQIKYNPFKVPTFDASTPFEAMKTAGLVDLYRKFQYLENEGKLKPQDANSYRLVTESLISLLKKLYLECDKTEQWEREVRFTMLPGDLRKEFLDLWAVHSVGVTVKINRKSFMSESTGFKQAEGTVLGYYHPGDRIAVHIPHLMDQYAFYPDELVIVL